MGLLIDGQWHDQWYDTHKTGGRFVREDSQFHGEIGGPEHPADPGRYHLYVSLACPWAHRTLIFRRLKQLQQIGVSIVSPLMGEYGWTFDRAVGSSGDELHGHEFLHQLYTQAKADYTGRVTVPVLWDCEKGSIVNNESADIIRIFNSAFEEEASDNRHDYYPKALREDIEDINGFVYERVNNGVYRAGFATTQEAYEEAYHALFEALDVLEERLSRQRFLAGERITEADWRLFTTLIRFDAVYHGHFKCNRQRLEDFPSMSNYLRELYQWPEVANTVDFWHIQNHYYRSHPGINPNGIVPAGPEIDFEKHHNRNQLPGYDASGARL